MRGTSLQICTIALGLVLGVPLGGQAPAGVAEASLSFLGLGECGHEKLVAFSCKRRGFCPSCGARRMAENRPHLVDHVIPPVPVRQWVISLPIPLRLLFAAQPQLLAPLLQAIHRVIAGFLVKQAGFKLSRADTGAGENHRA